MTGYRTTWQSPQDEAPQRLADSAPEVTDWPSRWVLAKSLINHREPSAEHAVLIVMALGGATLDDLVTFERDAT